MKKYRQYKKRRKFETGRRWRRRFQKLQAINLSEWSKVLLVRHYEDAPVLHEGRPVMYQGIQLMYAKRIEP